VLSGNQQANAKSQSASSGENQSHPESPSISNIRPCFAWCDDGTSRHPCEITTRNYLDDVLAKNRAIGRTQSQTQIVCSIRKKRAAGAKVLGLWLPDLALLD
jgi:hypothetical protein